MDTVEEGKQPLLITVTHAGDVPELRSIPSNEQISESANTSRWSFLFKLLLVITTIGVSTAGIALIILITPTPPTVHIHSMHIAFNERHLPIWSATFSIKNPNDKLRVTYESPSVCVFHRRKHVGTVRIGAFGQSGGEGNEVVVKGDETGVIDEEAARGMEEDVAMTGSVLGLDMVFLGRVGFYPAASTVWGKQNMTAICKNVRAMLSSDDDDDKLNKTKSWGLTFDDRQDCRVRLPNSLSSFPQRGLGLTLLSLRRRCSSGEEPSSYILVPHSPFLQPFQGQLVAAQVFLDSFPLQRFSFSSSSTTPESSDKESNAEASKASEEKATSEANESGEMSMDDLVKLVAEKDELLSEKEQEIKQMKDKVLRTYAEMENVMDRTRRDAENTKKYAIQNFAKSLLDVADNLGRASSVVKESFSKLDDTSKDSAGAAPLLKTLLEGVEMTEKQLAEVFKKFGMEKYDPINEPFDPNRHNAVFQVPDASKPEGTVAHVLKSGYTLFDRVIRPAEVGVTQGGESEEDKKESDA
ncbi:BnaA03g48280D [Brassica napus]|uniref:GrpE protein homolog n=1 Tax=Brassica napus TaxID=3708 RepID=A0A078I708_BRANA|nr:BnaA03g48280D [Brassica napus]